jgi:hypothetical protein
VHYPILRSPVLRFVLLGCALFAARRAVDARIGGGPREEVVVLAADVDRADREWTVENGAAPTEHQKAEIVERMVEEEILFREALARGLDKNDPVVADRLVKSAEFLEPSASRGALELEARSLGLEGSDIVIRRHLVQTMRLMLRALPPSDVPKPADLSAYLDQHREMFRVPSRVSFTHVYFSRSGRADARADAERALREFRELRGANASVAGGAAMGDPFIQGTRFEGIGSDALGKSFGATFATAIESMTPGAWYGPVASMYGEHLVWLEAREEARPLELAEIRNQVMQLVLEERRDAKQKERLAALRAKYDVTVADSAKRS